ncbi:MAG TPA: vanadium-dependent haloperoxidase [Ohtaekwangia sp.]|nr:vanadium-dependent haloperoxidase [Ohtaekwangia sp.]
MKKFYCMLAMLCFVSASCSEDESAWRSRTQDPGFLHRSVKQVTDVIVHDIFSPPVASRIYTYMTVAAYEAAIHQNPDYVTLAGQLKGLEPVPSPVAGEEYCFSLAAVQAMFKVARQLVFSEDKMDEFYTNIMEEFRDAGIPDDVFERSVTYGIKVADHIIAWSNKDNYKQTRSFPKYSIQNNADTWKPTPPAYMDAVEPHWNKIRTFVLDSAGQFKPEGPTPFSLDKNSQFYKEALEIHDMVKNLTPEQREIASFWDCNPFVMNVKGHVMFATKKISPGGHWMNITHVACRKTKADFVRSAEAYVYVAVALFDGFVSCWDEKYRSLVIRPETYINQYMDEEWVPLLQTPPFPEYTSGHSVISTSASTVLTSLFGDNFAFTDSTEIEFGLTARSFKSFNHAAEEAAVSRMYGGIHYRPAVENGVVEGRALGNFVIERMKTRKEAVANAE